MPTFGLDRVIIALVLLLASMAGGAALMYAHMAPKVAVAEERADTLAGQVREQNKAVESLREAEAKRKTDADVRVAAAAATARTAEQHAQELLSLARPPGVDECAAAQALIARELSK